MLKLSGFCQAETFERFSMELTAADSQSGLTPSHLVHELYEGLHSEGCNDTRIEGISAVTVRPLAQCCFQEESFHYFAHVTVEKFKFFCKSSIFVFISQKLIVLFLFAKSFYVHEAY